MGAAATSSPSACIGKTAALLPTWPCATWLWMEITCGPCPIDPRGSGRDSGLAIMTRVNGAGGRNRTDTLSPKPIRPARLPVPPRPQGRPATGRRSRFVSGLRFSSQPATRPLHRPNGGYRRNGRRSRPPPPSRARRDACGRRSLAALEVAIRGRGAAFAGLKPVGVHREAHRAAGLAPFEARRLEDASSPSASACCFDEAGARHDHGVDARRDLPALDHRGGGAQILDAAIGAGADEDAVDLRCR